MTTRTLTGTSTQKTQTRTVVIEASWTDTAIRVAAVTGRRGTGPTRRVADDRRAAGSPKAGARKVDGNKAGGHRMALGNA